LSGSNTETVLDGVEGFDLDMGGLLWTSGNDASISLSKNLPAQAELRMEISAMPGIYGQEVTLTLGDSTVVLLIQDAYATNELDVKFANTAPASQIKISIPTVQTNAEAGYGESELRTGLGIGRITLLSD
jgi:hypothetical protein